MVHGILDGFLKTHILRKVERNEGKVIRLNMTATENKIY